VTTAYRLLLRSLDTHQVLRDVPDLAGRPMSYVDARELLIHVEQTLAGHLHRPGCREYLLIEPLRGGR